MFLSPLVSKLKNRSDSERGLTLPELLVAMGLLVLVAGVALAIVLSTVASSNRFGQNTANQTEVANAINVINRDISSASGISYAAPTAMTLSSVEDNSNYTVKIFGYDPTKSGNALPSNFTVNTANLPNFPALIEQRQKAGASTVTQNVLVPGWVAGNQSTSLFTYYDKTDSQLAPNSSGVVAIPSSAVRIEFFIAAKVSDRNSNIELAGSAVLHSSDVQGVISAARPAVPPAPVLSGTLPEKSTTATLCWATVAGSTSYTIYRKVNSGDYSVLTIIGQPVTDSTSACNGNNQYLDTNLTLGNIYTYYIVAYGAGGPSINSNAVPLTVVPPKVTIVNINTKANLTDTYPTGPGNTSSQQSGATYTVARGLTDQITWTPVNGATGYYVYKDGNATPVATVTDVNHPYLSVRDSNVTYGDIHSYRVEAFNEGANCTGDCDGDLSDPVSLTSPPVAPSINANNAGVTDPGSQPYNRVWVTGTSANANGYTLYASGRTGNAADCSGLSSTNQELSTNSGSPTSNNVGWGVSTCYAALAYNDAGSSPLSGNLTVDQGPSAFSIVNQNTRIGDFNAIANGLRYTTAIGTTNQVTWNTSLGADGYRIYRDGSYVTTVDAGTRTWQDAAGYGQTHTYQIQSYTNWSGSRPEQTQNTGTAQLISAPTPPSISSSADDSSTGSKSINYVNVNGYGTNATSVTIYRSQAAASNPTCSTSSTLTSGAGNSNTDGNASWGQSTCYYAQAFNDAGGSQMSNQTIAAQKPGKFAVSSGSDDADWFKLSNSSSSGSSASWDFQRSDKDGASTNPNYNLSYSTSWSTSTGASFYDDILGYLSSNPSSSAQRESWSGNGYGTCNSSNTAEMNAVMPSSTAGSTTCLNGDGTASTARTETITNMSPGSYYRLAVIAVAPNGTRRGRAASFITDPAQPKFVGSFIYEKSSIAQCGRRVASIGDSVTFGTADSVQGKVNYTSDTDPKDWDTKGTVNSSSTAYLGIYSHPLDPHNSNNSSIGYARSYLSQSLSSQASDGSFSSTTFSGYSSYVEWHGIMPGSDCTVGSNGNWTALPDTNYFNNRHVWYYAKDDNANQSDYTSAPSAATQDDGLQSYINGELN